MKIQPWSALSLFSNRGRKRNRKKSLAQQRRPLGKWWLKLERLEDRTVPSIFAHTTYVFNPNSGPGPSGYSPAQIRHAYGFDQIFFNNGTVAGDGTGETIAIVDAYDDPRALSDLHQFDLQFNLPDPVFTKVNQSGGTSLPKPDTGWAEEISLDIEWAHAIAPMAKILLVETASADVNNLTAGVAWAARQPGVVAISMSWGASEFSGENSFDSTFVTPSGHPGVTFVASSGDAGAPPNYPSTSPNVLAVGGTSLELDAQNNILSESGWSGSGGGISLYESQPIYQHGVVTQSSTQRTTPDVAYNADDNTGYAVYDSYNQVGWIELGGTSAAAPQWAAFIAIADQGRALNGQASLDGPTQVLPLIYSLPSTYFHDITTGGSMGTPPYDCGPGYDLVTGRGTPVANQLVSFAPPPPADMGVTVSGPATVYTATNATYTITITNNGPNAAQGVVLTDTLPVASTFVSMQQTSGTDNFSLSQAVGSATETATGNIASGSTDTFTLVVFAPYNLNSGTSFNNTASVSATSPDPSTGNNSATVSGTLVQSPPPAQFWDGGFEVPSLGSGASAYQYDPSASPWSFVGYAGVSGNGSGFTSGNPNAPQGSQVAVLQGTGSFSQQLTLTAGSYTVNFSAAQRATNQSSSQTFQVLIDGTVVGRFTPAGIAYTALRTFVFGVTAGVHTVAFVGLNPNGGDNTAFIDQASINAAAPPSSQFQDGGFETPSLGSGAAAYQYDPSTSPWFFVGLAGVSGNGSAFTSGNPNAPQGSQVAILQGTGSFSQQLSLAAGTYAVSFSAAQRANHQDSSQTFQLTVDGTAVDKFTPSTSLYTTFTTNFTVAAGVHTVAFVGLNANGGDNTAFIDQASITAAPPPPIQDGSFETPSLGSGASAYQYDPPASPWSFVGLAGISGNNSGFTSGNPSAPQGSQVAILQGTGSFSQQVTLAAGTYAVSFSAAQRAYNQSSSQTFYVSIDGFAVGTFKPSGAAYSAYTTHSLMVAAGTHTIAFIGINPNGGDNTAFIDQVSINAAPPPPSQLQDGGFEAPSLGSGGGAYQYDPAASPWSFVGLAGVSGNGSAFTSGNPSAPQGGQVAFLQGTGSFTQQVNFSAGTYSLSFSAAQRAANQSSQTFKVLVDGTVVGTFTPSSTSYASFSTSFTVGAGVHSIVFVGLNPNGGDNTAFIDQVAIS
jgi:uncharacterized repeat protein (TIGR01451 family)